MSIEKGDKQLKTNLFRLKKRKVLAITKKSSTFAPHLLQILIIN